MFFNWVFNFSFLIPFPHPGLILLPPPPPQNHTFYSLSMSFLPPPSFIFLLLPSFSVALLPLFYTSFLPLTFYTPFLSPSSSTPFLLPPYSSPSFISILCSFLPLLHRISPSYTGKKENHIFLINKEIEKERLQGHK